MTFVKNEEEKCTIEKSMRKKQIIPSEPDYQQ